MMSIQYLQFSLFLFLLNLLFLLGQDSALPPTPIPSTPSSSTNQITLLKWQYCASCKGTIELFTTLATNKIIEMQNNGIASGEELDVAPLVNNLCDLKYFDRYAPFMRYGCIKLLNDHTKEFLNTFAGDIASTQFSVSKGNIFSKTKEICVNIANACPDTMFISPSLKLRTECNGCKIIMNDLDIMKKVLPDHLRYNHEINQQLIESLCQSLGFNHQPYTWLEEICDEMIDENMKEILNIVNMRDQLASTKVNPKQTLADRVCEEIYSCDEQGEL